MPPRGSRYAISDVGTTSNATVTATDILFSVVLGRLWCWPRTHRCKTRNSGTDRTDKSNSSGQHTSGADCSINLGLQSCICVAKSGLQVGKSFFYVYGFVQFMWLVKMPVMACASSGVNAPLAMSGGTQVDGVAHARHIERRNGGLN